MLANTAGTTTAKRRPHPCVRSRWLLSTLVAVAVLAAHVVDAEPAAAQADAGQDPVSVLTEGGFEVQRLGGADLYDTSLLIADEMVHRLGGKAPNVVVASGRSWQHAAVGASLAGELDLPLLLVPPGGLRSSALRLLEDVGVTKAYAIGGISVIPETDLGGVRDLGVSVERVGSDDPIATALAAASLGTAAEPARSSAPNEPALTGSPDTVTGLGDVRSPPSRAVVMASVEAPSEAHVAAPFSARARLPLLLTSPTSLDAATARFLDERAITHVVVSGVHGPPSDSLRDDLDALGISVVQIGNFGSLPASAAAADFAAGDSTGQFASWSRRPCPQQSSSAVGLASNLDVWDAFSAAPLLGQLCASLLLTSRHDLGSEANAVLYRALHTGTKSLLIFGGRAVIGGALAEQASSPRVPIRIATVTGGVPADEKGEAIVVIDENRRQRRYLSNRGFSEIYGRSLTWSPQRRHIAFAAVRDGAAGVFVFDVATGSFWRVTPARKDYWVYGQDIAWSFDGSRFAFSAHFEKEHRCCDDPFTSVHVADIRDRWIHRMSFDGRRERHSTWAPNDHRLLTLRFPTKGHNQYAPDELVIIDSDTRHTTTIDRYAAIGWPRWSPDGTMIAIETWSHRGGMDVARPEIVVIDAERPHGTLLEGPAAADGILAWAPSSCCIATFDGYYANDISLLDITNGRIRHLIPVTGDNTDYPEGTSFRGWSRDGLTIVATDDEHINGYGWWVNRIFMIETINGAITELPFEGPGREFHFGGFSSDGKHLVYGASEDSDSTFQLRIVGTAPGGQSRVGLDLTSDLPQLSGISENESFASWRGLRWTASGIHGAVWQWHWHWRPE